MFDMNVRCIHIFCFYWCSWRSPALKHGTASHCSGCNPVIYHVNCTTLLVMKSFVKWKSFCYIRENALQSAPPSSLLAPNFSVFISCQKLTKLGQFRVKDESPSSGPSLQPGSLFFSRDNATKSSTPLKGKSSCWNPVKFFQVLVTIKS